MDSNGKDVESSLFLERLCTSIGYYGDFMARGTGLNVVDQIGIATNTDGAASVEQKPIFVDELHFLLCEAEMGKSYILFGGALVGIMTGQMAISTSDVRVDTGIISWNYFRITCLSEGEIGKASISAES